MIAEEQLKIGKGTITVYDPKLVITKPKFDNMVKIISKVNNNTIYKSNEHFSPSPSDNKNYINIKGNQKNINSSSSCKKKIIFNINLAENTNSLFTSKDINIHYNTSSQNKKNSKCQFNAESNKTFNSPIKGNKSKNLFGIYPVRFLLCFLRNIL